MATNNTKIGLKLTATEKNANTVKLTDSKMASSSMREMTGFVIQT